MQKSLNGYLKERDQVIRNGEGDQSKTYKRRRRAIRYR